MAIKKRPWQAPQSAAPSIEIPNLKDQNNKERKKGGAAWFSGSTAADAEYGAVEFGEARVAQSAASAAARALVASSDVTGAGTLVTSFLTRFLATAAGKLALGAVALLVTGGALITAGVLSGGASSRNSGFSFGSIAAALHYLKPESQSLNYAAAAARGLNPQDPNAVGASGALSTNDEAQAAGGFTGSLAPGLPVGALGNFGGPSSVDGPNAIKNFDGGPGIPDGAEENMTAPAPGVVGGAFAPTNAQSFKAGNLQAIAGRGSGQFALGRFGPRSSEDLGLLRGMRSYIPGMTRTSGTTMEAPAQIAAEQFDASGIVGGSAPSAPTISPGAAPVMSGSPSGASSGAPTDGEGQCSQSQINAGMIWTGTQCASPIAQTNCAQNPPPPNCTPWQSQVNTSNYLIYGAAAILLIASILVATKLPTLVTLGQYLSGLAAVMGLGVVVESLLIGAQGQTNQAQIMLTAAAIIGSGAVLAMIGQSYPIIGAITGAIGGIVSLITTLLTSDSGATGGGSSSNTNTTTNTQNTSTQNSSAQNSNSSTDSSSADDSSSDSSGSGGKHKHKG